MSTFLHTGPGGRYRGHGVKGQGGQAIFCSLFFVFASHATHWRLHIFLCRPDPGGFRRFNTFDTKFKQSMFFPSHALIKAHACSPPEVEVNAFCSEPRSSNPHTTALTPTLSITGTHCRPVGITEVFHHLETLMITLWTIHSHSGYETSSGLPPMQRVKRSIQWHPFATLLN